MVMKFVTNARAAASLRVAAVEKTPEPTTTTTTINPTTAITSSPMLNHSMPTFRPDWRPHEMKSIRFKEPPIAMEVEDEIETDNLQALEGGGTVSPAKKKLQVAIATAPKKRRAARQWTDDELKFLYLIYLYSSKKIRWPGVRIKDDSFLDINAPLFVRGTLLMALVYEAVCEGSLGFHFAPENVQMVVEGKQTRLWLNYSQDAFSRIEKFRDEGLVELLKVPATNALSTWAVAVTSQGKRILEAASEDLVEGIVRIAHGGLEERPENLLQLFWRQTQPRLLRGKRSKATTFAVAEMLSFVTSPSLPAHLRTRARGADKRLTDNAHRAAEAARGIQTLKAAPSEGIMMTNVVVTLVEWIPSDRTHIFDLNQRLGSFDRTQMFVEYITHTKARIKARVLDFVSEKYVNFEAEAMNTYINPTTGGSKSIVSPPEQQKSNSNNALQRRGGAGGTKRNSLFPQEPFPVSGSSGQIVQIKQVGIHARADGCVVSSAKIESTAVRLVSHLGTGSMSRIIVSLTEDTTALFKELLSMKQRREIEGVYGRENAKRRPKQILLSVESITPKIRAALYKDDPLMENEWSQILGPLNKSFEISSLDLTVILGTRGACLVGPRARNTLIEQQVIPHLMLQARADAMTQMFAKLSELQLGVTNLQILLKRFDTEWQLVDAVHEEIAFLSRSLTTMEASLKHMESSLVEAIMPSPPNLSDPLRELFAALDCESSRASLRIRATSMLGVTQRVIRQIRSLHSFAKSLPRLGFLRSSFESQLSWRGTGRIWRERAESASVRMFVLRFIIASSFACLLIDRIAGGRIRGSDHQAPPSADFLVSIVDQPGGFLFFSGAVAIAFILIMTLFRAQREQHVFRQTYRTATIVNIENLADFLQSRELLSVSAESDSSDKSNNNNGMLMKARWQETDGLIWANAPPMIEIVWNSSKGILSRVIFEFNYNQSKTHDSLLWRTFQKVLDSYNVIVEREPSHLV